MNKQQKELSMWEDKKFVEGVKDNFGKNLTEQEFLTLCEIGKATGLNPFLREIWAVKYGYSSANIFIGRDGYRKSAQKSKNYDYHAVDAVYENDSFSVENGEVKHSYSLKDRGKIKGAYCIVKRIKSSKPTYTFINFDEYYKGKGKTDKKPTLWDTKEATMIKKVAEAQGLRMAFQEIFAGTYDESEQWENTNIDTHNNITTSKAITENKKTHEDKFNNSWDQYWELLYKKDPIKKNDEKRKITTCETVLGGKYNISNFRELKEDQKKEALLLMNNKIKELKTSVNYE